MKLLKYELAKLARPLLPLYAAGLILAGCSRLLLNSGSGVMMTLGGYASFVTVLVLAAAVIVTVLASWLSFYRNNFKPESYVMHSLPVADSRIWMSFILCGLLFITLSVATAILSIRILAPQVIMDNIQALIGQNPEIGHMLIWVMILAAEFQIILDWICGMTGMALGLKRHGSRLGMSVLWGVLLYVAVIVIQVLLALMVAGPDGMVSQDTMELSVFMTMMKTLVAGYGMMDLLLILLGGFVYSRGFDLE